MTFQPEIEFLLSKFSHEIRNPLTTLYSTVQLIEIQHPEVRNFRHWSGITEDIEYMNQLLDELSNFAKSERIHTEVFDLRRLLEKCCLSFAASIEDSEVTFSSKIDTSISEYNGDSIKLREVIINLLKNAYEASKPNHTVALEASVLNNDLIIRIQDTGCGISKEQLATIFDPFVTTKKEGTGLGLAICDHVIKAHNGTISVESEPGKGTTFQVTLPIPDNC